MNSPHIPAETSRLLYKHRVAFIINQIYRLSFDNHYMPLRSENPAFPEHPHISASNLQNRGYEQMPAPHDRIVEFEISLMSSFAGRRPNAIHRSSHQWATCEKSRDSSARLFRAPGFFRGLIGVRFGNVPESKS